jgi:hypothetical protein
MQFERKQEKRDSLEITLGLMCQPDRKYFKTAKKRFSGFDSEGTLSKLSRKKQEVNRKTNRKNGEDRRKKKARDYLHIYCIWIDIYIYIYIYIKI